MKSNEINNYPHAGSNGALEGWEGWLGSAVDLGFAKVDDQGGGSTKLVDDQGRCRTKLADDQGECRTKLALKIIFTSKYTH